MVLPVQREPATPAAGGGYFHNGNYQPADLLLTCNGLLMTCTKCKVGSSFTQRPGTDEPAKPCISTLSAVGTQLTLAPNFHLSVVKTPRVGSTMYERRPAEGCTMYYQRTRKMGLSSAGAAAKWDKWDKTWDMWAEDQTGNSISGYWRGLLCGKG